MYQLLFKSSFTSRVLKKRQYHVQLVRNEKTLSYYVFVDTEFKGNVESVERVKCTSFRDAFSQFYTSIVNYSGVIIEYYGDKLPF